MVLNYIWVAFFGIAFLIAAGKLVFAGDAGVFPAIMDSTFSSAKTAFEISLGLTGVLSLWMGIMKIGEKGGVVHILARGLSPLFCKLFPDIPKNHPVIGNIFMNISANMLGLDNAATPLGLKAMEGLQELNPKKDTASNPMIMFLVLNTSGLTIIPVSIMVYRTQMGAAQPTDVFIPILLATFASTLTGIIVTSLYQRINLLNRVVVLALGGACLAVAGIVYGFSRLDKEEMNLWSTTIANVLLFCIIIAFIAAGVRKRVNVYDAFIEGAKDGFTTAVRIIPYLVAILVGIGVFRASGAMDLLTDGIAAVVKACGGDADFVGAAYRTDETVERQRGARHDGGCHGDLRCRLLRGAVELYFPRRDRHHLLYIGRLLRQCGHHPHAACRGLRPVGRFGRYSGRHRCGLSLFRSIIETN
jgi:spore maturation protein SpmA